jgi:hypothetical protein
MTKRTSMSKIAEENIMFINEKRKLHLSFATIAEVMRNKGLMTNTTAVTKAYHKFEESKK